MALSDQQPDEIKNRQLFCWRFFVPFILDIVLWKILSLIAQGLRTADFLLIYKHFFLGENHNFLAGQFFLDFLDDQLKVSVIGDKIEIITRDG